MVLPVPFLHELSYEKVAYKSVWCQLEQRYEAGCGRQKGWATTYASFPSKLVSIVAVCTSAQR